MKATYDDIKRIIGDQDDHIIAEIEGIGLTVAELEEVSAHLAQETDVMGELRKPLTGQALTVYNLLRRQDAQWEEDR